MTEPQRISVAEVKRRFADVLGAVRYRDERFVIERNGTAVAALVPLRDLPPSPVERVGFLALVGAFTEEPEFADALDAAVESRVDELSRSAPDLPA